MQTAKCIACGGPFLRDDGEEWKRRCLPCWAASKGRTAPRPASPPDPIAHEVRERMRALLMLCHPDKHGGSALANRTTAWLLSLRERIAETEGMR